MSSSSTDPFEEHIRIDEKMKKLRDEIRQLCNECRYDEAIQRTNEELRPLHQKWFESLSQFFNYLRNQTS